MTIKEIQNLKKIELHRHLEGCIDTSFVKNHLEKYQPNHDLLINGNTDNLFAYSNFMDFLKSWGTVMSLLDDLEHFRDLAKHGIKQLKEENITYCEFIFSPQPFIAKGIDLEQLFSVMYEEFKKSGVETKIIVDFVRNFGEHAMNKDLPPLIELKKSNEELGSWIKAISIGGDEVNFPAPLFELPFKKAKEEGFHIYAHAGEWLGAESVWQTIKHLEVERIGHGIRSVDDPTLLKYLKDNKIGLDISVTSNYLTNAVKEGDRHPVNQIYDNGCEISLNTDDPGFFHTDLNNEYQRFVDYGYEISDLRNIIANAVELTFLEEDDREKLRSDIS